MNRLFKNPMLVGASLLLLLLFGSPLINKITGGDPPAEADGSELCENTELHFYAYDTPGQAFGPSVEEREVDKVLAELHARRCADPALVVAHREYADRTYTTPEQRDANVAGIASNREAWDMNIAFLEMRESTAVKVEIREITTDNQSMWMADTKPRPTIIKGPSDVTTFTALVFVYEDGTEDVYKLNCGFQPMAPDFPGVPTKPPVNPPCVCPPPSSTTPTTQPPPCDTTDCPPPTTVCPPPAGVPEDKWDYEKCHKKPTPEDEQQNGDTGVRQDPQDNSTSGVDVGPTKDSDGNPIAEPPLNPPAPAPNQGSNTPAPAPTPGGTNSGSPTGSGTPSGSATGGGNTSVGTNNTSPPADSGQGGDGNGNATSPFG